MSTLLHDCHTVTLRFAEGRHVVQGRAVGGEQLDYSPHFQIFKALAQAQDRQRAIEAAGIYDNLRLILLHGSRKIL